MLCSSSWGIADDWFSEQCERSVMTMEECKVNLTDSRPTILKEFWFTFCWLLKICIPVVLDLTLCGELHLFTNCCHFSFFCSSVFLCHNKQIHICASHIFGFSLKKLLTTWCIDYKQWLQQLYHCHWTLLTERNNIIRITFRTIFFSSWMIK